jgi:hypothetical protein
VGRGRRREKEKGGGRGRSMEGARKGEGIDEMIAN